MTGSIERGVLADIYHASPELNISRLKNIDKSGKHYQYFAEHPPTSKPMTLGTAAHCAVLEPERFAAQYIAWTRRSPETGNLCPRRGQHWEAFQADYAGKLIITEDEYSDACAMRDAIRSDATAMRYLSAGEAEVTLKWQLPVSRGDRRFTLPCRGRPDFIADVGGKQILVGIKTARDIRPIAFGNAAAKLGYPLSWAFYGDGYQILTGQFPAIKEIVVESSPPHDVVVYDIDDDTLVRGREEYERLLSIYCDCLDSGRWPGIANGEEMALAMPTWFFGSQIEDIGELNLEDDT